MEHVIQFAVGIDDERIEDEIYKSSEQLIVKPIKQDIINKIFTSKYYHKNANPEQDSLSELSKAIISEVFQENKDIIIEKTSKLLADKLCRTKAYKDKISNFMEEK